MTKHGSAFDLPIALGLLRATVATAADMVPIAPLFTPDGGYYFSDITNHRIRRVRATGIIRTIAGTDGFGFNGDNQGASSATLHYPRDVAQGPDGALYVLDGNNYRVRRITPDGRITTVLGTGVNGFSGDGGPATQATISLSEGIGVGPHGSLYLADYFNHRIRRVGPDGIVTTIAGAGIGGYGGDGGPAILAKLFFPEDVAVGPDGSIYIADGANSRVRRISPRLPGFSGSDIAIASEDGTEVYQFDQFGRHLSTRDALTGAVLLSFAYNSAGQLVSITDPDSNVRCCARRSRGWG